ncbi:hypothetical protein FVEN_g8255 [Fusarium venenatum]|uniref:VOC domain-containing protein n=1 Tax=Fusarium venenatum TaxID=56646 RepID=A0A2L2SS88_9HYPO|nr:uncharacterized protein FVRRES_04378 [Fusarium venenatum]KAG8353998.1 hypothetical protein FVEN_g8255 [Fusarium venenatum]KAH6991550.1 hypothetical protein EDB82DRAFT_494158 [Fusarium venenatum]CEI59942.1 unnamed protein product [Fusarium venenatum]
MASTSPIKVLHAPHTGITVRSLSRAIHLFQNILNLRILRTAHLCPPVSTVVGHPEAEIDIALVELPGGHLIELLEYSSPPKAKQQEIKPYSWDLGSWHLCLTVQNLEETLYALEGDEAAWSQLTAPQILEQGPNAGRKVVYVRNEDGLTLELFG